MRLEEATKELSFWEERFHDYNDPRMSKAVRLGIEALKRLEDLRSRGHPRAFALLPGETERKPDSEDKAG